MKRNDQLWKAALEDLFDGFLRFFFPNSNDLFEIARIAALLEGREEGREQGREEGREEGIKMTALKMKQSGLDIKLIASVTGLPIDVIESLS